MFVKNRKKEPDRLLLIFLKNQRKSFLFNNQQSILSRSCICAYQFRKRWLSLLVFAESKENFSSPPSSSSSFFTNPDKSAFILQDSQTFSSLLVPVSRSKNSFENEQREAENNYDKKEDKTEESKILRALVGQKTVLSEKKNNEPSFRISSKKIFLTFFHCNLSAEEMKKKMTTHLLEKGFSLLFIAVCSEQNTKISEPYPLGIRASFGYLHLLFESVEKKFDSSSPKFFDIKGDDGQSFHPLIQAAYDPQIILKNFKKNEKCVFVSSGPLPIATFNIMAELDSEEQVIRKGVLEHEGYGAEENKDVVFLDRQKKVATARIPYVVRTNAMAIFCKYGLSKKTLTQIPGSIYQLEDLIKGLSYLDQIPDESGEEYPPIPGINQEVIPLPELIKLRKNVKKYLFADSFQSISSLELELAKDRSSKANKYLSELGLKDAQFLKQLPVGLIEFINSLR